MTHQNNAKIIALLQEWLNDDSGYDEHTWPKLHEALRAAKHNDLARRVAQLERKHDDLFQYVYHRDEY